MKTRSLFIPLIILGELSLLHVQGNEPRTPAPSVAAKPEATTKQVVRIYAVRAILGAVPKEGDEVAKKVRAECWDSLMSLFDTALIMAGCEQPRPTFGLHNQSNCLAVGGTSEQIELISQAISACLENEQPRHQAVMPVRVVK
jgi:hypothetical protein